jgi:prepilin-type N-terminal cleavage/methylation domain-containing protein
MTAPIDRRRRGFTLVEIMITMAITTFLVAGMLASFILAYQYWHRTSLEISTTRIGSGCLEKMIYGCGTSMGLRAAIWVTNQGSATNWIIRSSNYYEETWYSLNTTQRTVTFSNASGRLVIGTNIVASTVTQDTKGLSISLTLQQSDGPFPDGNKFSTYVKIRAPQNR